MQINGRVLSGEVNVLAWVTGTVAVAPVNLALVVAAEQIVCVTNVAAAAAAVTAAAAAASSFEDRVPFEQQTLLHHHLPVLLQSSSCSLRPPAPWATAACAWSDWPTCAAGTRRASAWA